ncbi:MAG: hypothetical protein WD601_08785 [Pseudohongiellaceae bacterium]
MKKVLIGLGLVLVVVAGGVVYVLQNLDSIVRNVIETAGSEAVGSEVRVGRVEINLSAGSASIFDFTVANPQGFSDRDMLRFDELSVDLDLANTSAELIHITSVVSRNPFVFYETIDGNSNLDAVSARFASDEEAAPAQEGSQLLLALDSVLVEGIQGSIQSDMLPRNVDVNLGTVRLENLAGTPAGIAEQIMAPLIAQLSRTAASALVAAVQDIVGENAANAARQLQEEAGNRLEQVEDQANESLNEALGEEVREGLGDLFRRN